MHRIVKAHLDSFVRSRALEAEPESAQFEKFATHSVISSRFNTTYELDDVTTSANDDGIDGIAVIIDEEVAVSVEDTESIFRTPRRNHDVDIMFIQAKRSENFDLGDFLKFQRSILRFIQESPYSATDETLKNAREIFDVAINEVPKIRNGKPSLTARFVTTGLYRNPAELEKALSEFRNQLIDLSLFAEVDLKFIDRDDLTQLWVGTYSGTNATLDLFSQAALPEIAGIDEAYLAVVKANDFVENLLVSADGNLRTQVFEENVRSFLGVDNAVNQSIIATVRSDGASRFPVMNNGITIVSPDVQLQGNKLHLKNFQIVNGCQTSNVLFENRSQLKDIMVNIKIVETQNEDVFSELVRATNSQSKVDEKQFLSLRPIIKKVEQYFNTYDGTEGRLYFERRDRQYVGQEIPALRIFSVHNAAQCISAMFCNRPELASRYPKTMYEELTDVIFHDDVKEIVFYASCLTLYRFNLLVSNSTIPQNMKRFKWHMLAIARAILVGKEFENINSRKVEKSAQTVIEAMSQHGPVATEIFTHAVHICQSLGDVSRDRLKRQAILTEMLAKVS
jgi:hypothetical protein